VVTAGVGRAAALPARLRARLPAGVARRWVALGIRGRVLAWFVVLLALATVTSVVLQRQILHARLIERIDAQLNQEAEELRLLIGGAAPDGSCISGENPGGTCEVGRDPATGQPFGDDVGAIFETFLSRNNPGEHEGSPTSTASPTG
jgi:hypothetical protein